MLSNRNGSSPGTKSDPTVPKKNVIFWGTPPAPGISLIQKLRTSFWFYPDILSIAIHRFRPLSYLLLYTLFLLLGWRTITYAGHNPQSVLNTPPPQELHEGVIGSISSINPLYVTHNQIERDLQQLIFTKLIHIGRDSNPKPEAARTWAVSEDGTQYTFFLRQDILWHDGERLTADDVIFTFETIQSMEDEDSYSSEFENITFSRIDDFTVLLELPETNPTLLDSLAFPIIPEHILSEIPTSKIRFSSFNQLPVGSGPFKITRNNKETVVLQKNEDYFKGEPKLDTIIYHFYSTDDEALAAIKKFEIHTLTSGNDKILNELHDYDAYTTHNFTTLLRQKLVYFNTRGTGSLSSTSVRLALSAATHKKEILERIPGGGTVSQGPIPQNSWAYDDTVDRYKYNVKRANKLLDQSGWKYSDENAPYRTQNGETLSIKLSYLQNSLNEEIAENLRSQWAEVGIELILDPQSYERVSSETVPRRNFEALLFEIECTPDPDKYNLWHSTKSEYPGLNLSGYAYERVDILLERARTETDKELRKEDYSLFQKYIMSDMPALYLYHPSYTFIAHDSVAGIELSEAILPHHRYNAVENWYIR